MRLTAAEFKNPLGALVSWVSSKSYARPVRREFRLQLLVGSGERVGASSSKLLCDVSSSAIDSSSVSFEGLSLKECFLLMVSLPLIENLLLTESLFLTEGSPLVEDLTQVEEPSLMEVLPLEI